MRIDRRKISTWAIYVYGSLMPLCMGILLFVLPALRPRLYFMGSAPVDFLARLILWLYTTFIYWSACYGLLLGLRKGDLSQLTPLRRDTHTLIGLFAAAVGIGFMLAMLTWASLLTFAGQADNLVAMAVAAGNGLVYAAVGFSQYFILPRDT